MEEKLSNGGKVVTYSNVSKSLFRPRSKFFFYIYFLQQLPPTL